MNIPIKTLTVLVGATALTGCAVLPQSAPNVDAGFGSAVRQVMAAQTANPNAGRGMAAGPQGFDGQSAVSAVVRHRATFKDPPPTFSIVGIGGGSSQ